jgi:hypothetical protein
MRRSRRASGEVDAADQREAIEKAAKEFKLHPTKQIAVRGGRSGRGRRAINAFVRLGAPYLQHIMALALGSIICTLHTDTQGRSQLSGGSNPPMPQAAAHGRIKARTQRPVGRFYLVNLDGALPAAAPLRPGARACASAGVRAGSFPAPFRRRLGPAFSRFIFSPVYSRSRAISRRQ